jgi:hypothetical protein
MIARQKKYRKYNRTTNIRNREFVEYRKNWKEYIHSTGYHKIPKWILKINQKKKN